MGLIADLDAPHTIPSRAKVGRATPRAPFSETQPEHTEKTKKRNASVLFCSTQVTARAERRALPAGGTILDDTPLVPRAAAEAVWEEACVCLRARLPAGWATQLAEKAETLYARNPRFRARLCASGDDGRAWLWAFLRHWLAARVKEEFPHLFPKLPSRYSVGVL